MVGSQQGRSGDRQDDERELARTARHDPTARARNGA